MASAGNVCFKKNLGNGNCEMIDEATDEIKND